jgi:hypothetical protein
MNHLWTKNVHALTLPTAIALLLIGGYEPYTIFGKHAS